VTRKIAETYQIQLTGILGVLIEAKQRGLLTQIKPILDALIYEADFWISERLYHRVLESVNE
jgi:hypothetical protein